MLSKLFLLLIMAPAAKGTLVLTLGTSEGVVTCSDRREYNRPRGASDNQDKLFKLSNASMFSMSGNLGILSPRDLRVLYSVPEVVKTYLDNKSDRVIETHWEGLKKELEISYTRYLKKGGLAWKPEPTFDGWLYLLTFVYLDPQNRIKIRSIGAKFEEPNIRITDAGIPVGILGQVDVVTEVKTGHDPRFDDIRELPLVKKAFNKGSVITVTEAVSFSRTMIQATSQRHPLLKPSGTPLVSENYDCGIVKPSGFFWLKQNAR